MFSYLWHTLFFDPIYNTLIFFIDLVPRGDVGLAIIGTIVVVKLLLLPLSIRAAKTQKVMKEIEPKLKEIKETHKDDRSAQAQAMMDVYKDASLNPFASIALIFIQIPIVIALYFAVYRGGGVPLPQINVDLLYAFVAEPVTITMNFLNLIDISGRSLVLAILAGASQFVQISMTLPKLPPRSETDQPNLKDEFVRNMQTQMKYVMPVIIGVFSYTISAAIALYFFVSNVVGILLEFYIRKHR